MSISYGQEELKYLSRCLYSFNVVDGDEFEIDLKPPPPPINHSASEHQFQHHTNPSQSTTKPLAIRNRKISDNSSSGESTCFTRVVKKPKPIMFFSGHLTKTTSKKNESMDDFRSLPNNLSKKNRTMPESSDTADVEADKTEVVFTGGQNINESS